MRLTPTIAISLFVPRIDFSLAQLKTPIFAFAKVAAVAPAASAGHAAPDGSHLDARADRLSPRLALSLPLHAR